MIEVRWDVYKIIEERDGCVYKTKHIKTLWLPLGQGPRSYEERATIAKEHGGDQLHPGVESRTV